MMQCGHEAYPAYPSFHEEVWVETQEIPLRIPVVVCS
jgi:hypothetical protein